MLVSRSTSKSNRLTIWATVLCIFYSSALIGQSQRSGSASKRQSQARSSNTQNLYATSVQALQQGDLGKPRTRFESLVNTRPALAACLHLLVWAVMLHAAS